MQSRDDAGRYRARDARARKINAHMNDVLNITREARAADAECETAMRAAVDNVRAFLLRAGWIE